MNTSHTDHTSKCCMKPMIPFLQIKHMTCCCKSICKQWRHTTMYPHSNIMFAGLSRQIKHIFRVAQLPQSHNHSQFLQKHFTTVFGYLFSTIFLVSQLLHIRFSSHSLHHSAFMETACDSVSVPPTKWDQWAWKLGPGTGPMNPGGMRRICTHDFTDSLEGSAREKGMRALDGPGCGEG